MISTVSSLVLQQAERYFSRGVRRG
jgi:hypothetical protein